DAASEDGGQPGAGTAAAAPPGVAEPTDAAGARRPAAVARLVGADAAARRGAGAAKPAERPGRREAPPHRRLDVAPGRPGRGGPGRDGRAGAVGDAADQCG